MTYTFPVHPWSDTIAFYERLMDDGATFVAPMLAVARSVVDEGAEGRIGGHTSMHDLVVTSLPVGAEPFDHVRVAILPGSEKVRIGHFSGVGQDDEIERPTSEILPLFWRVMIEKYGVHPARDLKRPLICVMRPCGCLPRSGCSLIATKDRGGATQAPAEVEVLQKPRGRNPRRCWTGRGGTRSPRS